MSPHPPSSAAIPLSPLVVAAVNVAFWGSLLVCTGLFSLLVLGPRIVAWEDLALQHRRIAREHRRLDRGIAELQSLAFALEHDPSFARKVAMDEFDLAPQGVDAVEMVGPVTDSVEHDSEQDSPLTNPWYLPVVRRTAIAGSLRTRLTFATATLCLLAFVCLNERFLLGGVGRHLQEMGRWISSRYGRLQR